MPIDPPAPLDREALGALKARHAGPMPAFPDLTGTQHFRPQGYCPACWVRWPCDTAQALALLEAADAQAAWWQANREQLSTTLGAVIDDRDAENAHLRAALEPLVRAFERLQPGDEIVWTPTMVAAVAAGRRALENR